MPHCDPETLALRALGESTSAADEAHLATCAACQSELDQLRAVVATARSASGDDPVVAPRAHVWDGVAAQLNLSDRSQPATPVAGLETDLRVVPGRSQAETGRRSSSAARRRRPSGFVLAAAAAIVGLLVGIVGTAVAQRSPGGAVLAKTSLEPVDAGDAHGRATLQTTSHGRVLRVDLTGLPKTSGYYEVWFMNAVTGGAVSLGSLDPGRLTTFDVPAGLRLSDYPYVDVSVEPLDGNPAHSSDSVARGRIGA